MPTNPPTDAHGRDARLPQAAGFLLSAGQRVAPELVETTRELADFRQTSGELTLSDRRIIVGQAITLLQENYVHLPLKRAMHAVDPIQRLRLLDHRLQEQDAASMGPEVAFHAEVSDIFNSLRDLHTAYSLPAPFSSRVAWLPFLIEEYLEGEPPHPRYVVTKVVGDAGPPDFVPGVEVTHWNGMTLAHAISRNADRQAGSNPDARHARGLNSLTMRPLVRSLPPDEDWVTLRYVPLAGPIADGDSIPPVEYTQPWLVFQPGQGARFSPASLVVEATAVGLDDQTDDIQQVRKVLLAPDVAAAEAASRTQVVTAPVAQELAGPDGDVVASTLPGVLKARTVRKAGAGPADPAYGYIRIYTFNVAEASGFVNEFVRLVEALPANGLILDVRGNGGGLIYAAEELLQILSPRWIEPERAQFITTPLNLAICRNHEVSKEVTGLELEPWIESISASVKTGATYSQGFPITPVEECNDVGQRYFGPTVLITDPLCYSATDMFAAGFQDHRIGTIIGVGGATGAGGANVWTHGLLSKLMAPDFLDDPGPTPYRPLPGGADMRVAARRTTRVGIKQGDILEDLGVEPDVRYRMTRRDILEGNLDLIDRAIDELAKHKPHPTSITVVPRPGRLPLVRVQATNVTRIDARLAIPTDGDPEERWFASRAVRGGRVLLDPDDILDRRAHGSVGLQITGYDGDTLVARLKETLELG